MKNLFLMIGLSLLFNYAKSQNSNFDSKYDDPNFNALKVVKVIDECGFKPARSTSDMRQFKSVILSLSERAYQQINIDTWAICNKKREENYLMYNMYYKPVTRNYFDENCKALITLMIIEGVAVK
jgi:hypothetical protein